MILRRLQEEKAASAQYLLKSKDNIIDRMTVGTVFHFIFKIFLILFIIFIILIGLFLAYVVYKLYIAKDPLPKVPRNVLGVLSMCFIFALFLFAGMMLLVIIYVCYKVFTLKEPIAFPKQEKKQNSI